MQKRFLRHTRLTVNHIEATYTFGDGQQRAMMHLRFVQAVVNEDAAGTREVLQAEVQRLKRQLAALQGQGMLPSDPSLSQPAGGQSSSASDAQVRCLLQRQQASFGCMSHITHF